MTTRQLIGSILDSHHASFCLPSCDHSPYVCVCLCIRKCLCVYVCRNPLKVCEKRRRSRHAELLVILTIIWRRKAPAHASNAISKPTQPSAPALNFAPTWRLCMMMLTHSLYLAPLYPFYLSSVAAFICQQLPGFYHTYHD